MFEFEARELRVGDEFTIDQGETWRRVTGVVDLKTRLRIFCWDETAENPGPTLSVDTMVIVK